MAKATKEFDGAVSRNKQGQVVVRLSDVQADSGFIIEGLNGRPVQFIEPAAEQNNAPGVISSSPTAAAFNPANAVVKAGQVQLNKLSKYLADLPDTAKAELLVAPKDTAKIFGRGLGTFNEDTASIRAIGESHGIHHEGQALTGMQIFDRPDSYERAWAKEVRAAWEQANASGEAVTTGLAMGTKQIVHGCEIGTRDVTVANNLYSRRNDINAALKAQGGQEIITSVDSGIDHWQFTASVSPVYCSVVYSVDFTGGDDGWGCLGIDLASSRPVALQIAPAP
ncbi:MAG: hypothetical protein LRY54_01775 [Alphaproteobacteria bacterium]|nr:hypothetical protein [Alphaproteobacteria bacterium]